MANGDPFNLGALMDPFSSVDFRKLLLLPVPQNPAPNANNWQGTGLVTTVGSSPAATGVTAPGSPAIFPVAPSRVVAPIPMAVPPPNLKYPTPREITGTLYNETSVQRQVPGGPSLDTLRDAMANAILNARDQNVPRKNYAASPDIDSGEMGSILNGIIHPNSPNRAAADAWFSSLGAGVGAHLRSSPPASGPGSGVFFNGRPDASSGPNVYPENKQQEPFVGTLGPYSGGRHPWWAFFRKPGT